MEYPGCVLVTSHDRWFLDRLATHILAYEGDSQVVWFEGNFEEYEKTRSAASATTLWYRMPLSTGNLPARETLV